MQEKLCECGCGKEVKNRFVHNHDKIGAHLSLETRKKISEKAKGRVVSEETRQKLSDSGKGKCKGEKHWNWGKHLSAETRKKIGDAERGEKHYNWGKHLSAEARKKISEAHKGKVASAETRKKIGDAERGEKHWNFGGYISEETRKKISEALRGKYGGEKNPRWLGGISFEPYTPEFNDFLKLQIKTRDDFTCQRCGATTELCIHHISYCKKNCDPKNLITLCISCNFAVNTRRVYWTAYFKKILADSSKVLEKVKVFCGPKAV